MTLRVQPIESGWEDAGTSLPSVPHEPSAPPLPIELYPNFGYELPNDSPPSYNSLFSKQWKVIPQKSANEKIRERFSMLELPKSEFDKMTPEEKILFSKGIDVVYPNDYRDYKMRKQPYVALQANLVARLKNNGSEFYFNLYLNSSTPKDILEIVKASVLDTNSIDSIKFEIRDLSVALNRTNSWNFYKIRGERRKELENLLEALKEKKDKLIKGDYFKIHKAKIDKSFTHVAHELIADIALMPQSDRDALLELRTALNEENYSRAAEIASEIHPLRDDIPLPPTLQKIKTHLEQYSALTKGEEVTEGPLADLSSKLQTTWLIMNDYKIFYSEHFKKEQIFGNSPLEIQNHYHNNKGKLDDVHLLASAMYLGKYEKAKAIVEKKLSEFLPLNKGTSGPDICTHLSIINYALKDHNQALHHLYNVSSKYYTDRTDPQKDLIVKRFMDSLNESTCLTAYWMMTELRKKYSTSTHFEDLETRMMGRIATMNSDEAIFVKALLSKDKKTNLELLLRNIQLSSTSMIHYYAAHQLAKTMKLDSTKSSLLTEYFHSKIETLEKLYKANILNNLSHEMIEIEREKPRSG